MHFYAAWENRETNYHGTYIRDGNMEIDAHVWINFCVLICLKHLFTSIAVAKYDYFYSEK